MISNYCMKETTTPVNIIKKIRYDINFRRDHPFYFYPDNLVCLIGPQGSGKTLSAVNYVYNLLICYPKAIIVTNIDLTDYPIDNERVFRFENADDLKKYKNGEFGVIFFIDEIQLYFNSLQSKNINMDVMTQISQQRKQRIHIVATSQVFGRLAKPLREQFSAIVLCKCYFGCLQRNMLIDRDSICSDDSSDTNLTADVKKSYWWFRSPEMYSRYDTYAVINNKYLSAAVDSPVDIYEKRGVVSVSKLPNNS